MSLAKENADCTSSGRVSHILATPPEDLELLARSIDRGVLAMKAFASIEMMRGLE